MEKIDIINNTQMPVNVNFSLPEQTVATIQLKKLESLHAAILENNPEKIKIIAFSGVNINQEKDGKTPLLLALLLKRYEAFNMLLELGAKPDDVCLENAWFLFE